MKKELFIASMVAAASVFAAEFESNSMSVLPVDAPPCTVSGGKNLMLLTAPFKGYQGAESITVSDVLLTTGLSDGDKLYIQADAKGKYNCYTLGSGSWTAANQITITTAGGREEGSLSANEATIQRGKPFWLETAATSVTLLGETLSSQVPTSLSTTRGAYTLVAPTTSESPVALTGESAIGKNGDRILFADGTMYLKANDVWVQQKPSPNTTLSKGNTIPVGVGFWYMSADGSLVTL